ncbi:MAG: AraC family transcriptional regulator ligand-binding domain-containing protein [Deltaproteobacteria bacterium]|nr:AraC family transcriptional regulator ligand-binding domain-containing protein [Deltaproteobacteria bacterium]
MRDVPVRWQIVGAVLGAARERGVEVEALLRARGLPPSVLAEREVVLPVGVVEALFDEAAERAGEPHLGALAALSLKLGSWDIVEFGARSAPTLRAGLVAVARYAPLFNDVIELHFENHGTTATLAQRIPGRPRCVGAQAGAFWVANILTQSRAVTGRPCTPHTVRFAHEAPPAPERLLALLGLASAAFSSGANEVTFAAEDLDAPLRTHDPALASMVDRLAAPQLAKVRPAAGVAATVRAYVSEHLAQGVPSLESAARALRVSERSLQRHLADDGTSYLELVDDLRRELACAGVRDEGRSLDDLAAALGYAERSAIVRAFRRWTGTTPARFRRG